MDTYASEGLSKIFLSILRLYCLSYCHDKPRKQEFLFADFPYFLKIHHKILYSSKLVNFFLFEGGPSLAHSKNINFIGRECSNFEEGWVEE